MKENGHFAGSNSTWEIYVRGAAQGWSNYIRDLVINRGNRSVLVVRYEDLHTDVAHEVSRLYIFIKLACVPNGHFTCVAFDYPTNYSYELINKPAAWLAV